MGVQCVVVVLLPVPSLIDQVGEALQKDNCARLLLLQPLLGVGPRLRLDHPRELLTRLSLVHDPVVVELLDVAGRVPRTQDLSPLLLREDGYLIGAG